MHDYKVYVTFLNRPPCNARGGSGIDGEVVAFAVGFGRIQWRTKIGPSETSPLVANGLVYVGDWRGNVYALDERNGKVRWRFKTQGAIKSGESLVLCITGQGLKTTDPLAGELPRPPVIGPRLSELAALHLRTS